MSYRDDIYEFLDFREEKVLNENSLSTASYMTSTPNSPYFWGIEYNIVPLQRNLDQRGNDKETIKNGIELYSKQFYSGQKVIGISTDDHEEHTGLVVGIIWSERRPGAINFIVILDNKTQTMTRLIPSTVKHVTNHGNNFIRKRKTLDFKKILHEQDSIDIPEFDDFDMSVDETMYREELIEKYPLQSTLIDYFDRKFTGNFYVNNFIEVEQLPFNLLLLIGANDREAANADYAKRAVETYIQMTHQPQPSLKVYVNRTFRVDCRPKKLLIRSWTDLYMLTLAIKRTWRSFRWTGDYHPASPRYVMNWNRDTENEEYKKQMAEFLKEIVILQLPEHIKDDEGNITKRFNILESYGLQ